MASFHLYHKQTTNQYKKHIVDGIYIDYHLWLRQRDTGIKSSVEIINCFSFTVDMLINLLINAWKHTQYVLKK